MRLQRTQDRKNIDTLLERLRATAVERDRAGGHPAAEKALLRDHGLLVLSVPQELGGTGADWPDILATVRRIATVDSSLAHLLAFQHLQLSGVLAYGSAEQQALSGMANRQMRNWNGIHVGDIRVVGL